VSEPAPVAIIHVPADYPTIQGAIDVAEPGSTILVADGVYRGAGNRDLTFRGKVLTLRSENGPERAIIDCEGRAQEPHSGFLFGQGDDGTVEGLTVRGGFASSAAAVYCQGASPTLRNCIFAENAATVSGGALRCKSASPNLIGCTFARNEAPAGGGVFLIARSSPEFLRCLIALSGEGGAVFVSDGSCRPIFRCCDIFGNAGGDWAGDIAAQKDSAGNFQLDPRFCDGPAGDYRLRTDSPCSEDQSPCGDRVGALGADCR